ncbi:MAG: alpha/beta hydrolase [Halioglobus sp.]
MTKREPSELSWQVNGLTLGGLSWGDPELPPLLMLHGWLDNAASFSLLAPFFPDHYVVAIDLTGHGKSDRRSADANYQIWEDLPEIMGVVEHLGWTDFDLLGHSRGAIIASLLASSFPEKIKHLVLLDAIIPQAVAEEEFPAQLRKYLEQKPSLVNAKNRIFADLGDAVVLREKNGLSGTAAKLIVERGLTSCDEGLTWTTDRRLYGASAVKLTQGQIQAVLQNLAMPALLLLAEGGRMALTVELESTLKSAPQLQVEFVAGGHHFHMENSVASVADRIQNLLQGDKA